jgi:hypothetical protein
MKPIKKEDMPKLIVLIVLAVGIFAFAVVQMISLAPPSVAATNAAAPGTTGTQVRQVRQSSPRRPARPHCRTRPFWTPRRIRSWIFCASVRRPAAKIPFAPNGAASPASMEAAKAVASAPVAPQIISTPLPQARRRRLSSPTTGKYGFPVLRS